jgi:hypothetical protein
MARLYIANCTKQRHEFLYRAPEQKNHIKQPIEIGSQIAVWKSDGTASRDDLQIIVEQHTAYGLVDVSEIDRTKHFVGMCYSFDKPVDIQKIMYTIESNDAVLEQRSLDLRKEGASVISHTLNQIASDAGNGLNNVEIEVKEVVAPGKEMRFDEKITVTQNGRQGKRNR